MARGRQANGSPSDIVALEQGLLGAALLHSQELDEWQSQVTEADFYDARHRTLWSAMANMDRPFDQRLFTDHLIAEGLMDAVGGVMYLTEVSTGYAPPAAIPQYITRILEEADRRSLRDMGADLVQRCDDATANATDLNEHLTSSLQDLARRRQPDGFVSIAAITDEFRKELTTAQGLNRPYAGLDTGFDGLNATLNGLCGSELTVLGARPSIGKTTLALQISKACVDYEKQPCAFFSLEMSAQQLLQRLVCIQAGISVTRLRRGMLKGHELDIVEEALATVSEWPLYIDDTSGLTIPQMRARMLKMERAHGIKLWVVDYLQLMNGSGVNENEQINSISKGLKGFTKMFNQPLVVLSQLNRTVESRSDKRPQLADCRGSGGIEQDADSVMLLYRPGFYTHLRNNWKKKQNDVDTHAELIVEKCRFGPTNDVPLRWIPDRAEFANR